MKKTLLRSFLLLCQDLAQIKMGHFSPVTLPGLMLRKACSDASRGKVREQFEKEIILREKENNNVFSFGNCTFGFKPCYCFGD